MDFLIGGSVAAFIMYAAANWQDTDKKKIQKTFSNLKYQVGDHSPKLIRTHKNKHYTTYTYSVPYGLIDDDKLNVLEKVLNRPVEVSFTNTKLHIKIYKNKLPTRLNYDWKHTNKWSVPIGYTQEKLIMHDFDKIPHMTIAGMTRQGKTVLLKLLFSQMILNNPDDVEFHIIDLKGGLEFGPYEKLKQVKSVSSNVKEAKKVLSIVSNDINSNMSMFKSKGYRNILDTPIKTRKFIIVDEGAELVPPSHLSKEEKQPYQYCQTALSEIARVAGALGYRLIFCTQYPTADTLPRQVKQNADAKISFRLPTEIASRVAIDEQGAEAIGNVGRAIYRTHEEHTLQVPYIDDKDIMKELGKYVSATTKERTEGTTDTVIFG